MNEVNAERDRVVVVVVAEEEEEESFKANSVKEVNAERDRATPASVDVSYVDEARTPISPGGEVLFQTSLGRVFFDNHVHAHNQHANIHTYTYPYTYIRTYAGGLKV